MGFSPKLHSVYLEIRGKNRAQAGRDVQGPEGEPENHPAKKVLDWKRKGEASRFLWEGNLCRGGEEGWRR